LRAQFYKQSPPQLQSIVRQVANELEGICDTGLADKYQFHVDEEGSIIQGAWSD